MRDDHTNGQLAIGCASIILYWATAVLASVAAFQNFGAYACAAMACAFLFAGVLRIVGANDH